MSSALRRRAVALAGASGYSGQEFLKLTAGHPGLEVVAQIGRETDIRSLKGVVEAAVLATPAEVSLEMTPALLELGIRVVDISGAYRLKTHSYSEWYGFEHPGHALLKESIYGLYPWVKPTTSTRLVANPGCYTTTALMAILPLLTENLVRGDSLAIDAASGASGAGKKVSPNLMFSELFGNSYAYKTGKHQHWPEIVEYLALSGASAAKPIFTTKLIPTFRGILATIFADWHPSIASENRNVQTLLNAFQKHYADQPDIVISESEVTLAQVVNTSKFAVSAHVAYGKPVIFCAIDNLGRGAAGQALMNLNQLFGRPAHEGLV